MRAEAEKNAGGYQGGREAAPPSQNASEREIQGVQKAPQLICARCQKPFSPNRKGQKFCRQKCRRDAWERKHHATSTVSEEPAEPLGTILVMAGKSDGKLSEIPCGFCRRWNKVDLSRDGRQNAICRCGARYFCRVRRLGSRLIEDWGWKKGKHRSFYI